MHFDSFIPESLRVPTVSRSHPRPWGRVQQCSEPRRVLVALVRLSSWTETGNTLNKYKCVCCHVVLSAKEENAAEGDKGVCVCVCEGGGSSARVARGSRAPSVTFGQTRVRKEPAVQRSGAAMGRAARAGLAGARGAGA